MQPKICTFSKREKRFCLIKSLIPNPFLNEEINFGDKFWDNNDKFSVYFNFSEASLRLVSRLLTAIILCILVSYLLFIFYGIYLPALQTLVQSQNMGEGGNSKENIFALQAMKWPCMKIMKAVEWNLSLFQMFRMF